MFPAGEEFGGTIHQDPGNAQIEMSREERSSSINEMHPSGEIQWVAGYRHQEFRGEIGIGNLVSL